MINNKYIFFTYFENIEKIKNCFMFFKDFFLNKFITINFISFLLFK